MNTMATILGLIVGVCGGVYLFLVLNYKSDTKNDQKMSFSQFHSLYMIAPEKWRIRYSVISSASYEGTPICMRTYFDYRRFHRFAKKIDKNITNMALMEERARLLKEWQQDINKFHEQETELLNGLKGKVS